MEKFYWGMLVGASLTIGMEELHNGGESVACKGSYFISQYFQCMVTVGLLKPEKQP